MASQVGSAALLNICFLDFRDQTMSKEEFPLPGPVEKVSFPTDLTDLELFRKFCVKDLVGGQADLWPEAGMLTTIYINNTFPAHPNQE